MDWDRIADWDRITAELTIDEGAYRDIYVHDTSLADWQHILDALRKWTPAPSFNWDGEPADLPERVEEIFRRSGDQEQDALLSVVVGGGTANCHFFCKEEIEFDIDPREVTDPTHVDALANFMSVLGEATGKPVVLTAENLPEAVMFRYSPHTGKVEWVTSAS